MSTDERAEIQQLAREQALRDHEAKKKYPKVSEVSWTHKDRKKRTVVQELTRLLRQLHEYLKVDAIRETAFVLDENQKAALRATRMAPMSLLEASLPPPGVRLDQDGAPALDQHGKPNIVDHKRYAAFQEANMTLVNCILDAVRDPTLNNELEKIHSRHADAKVAVRTGIMLVKHLKHLFDSDDFVHRFLHLLDFIEWEQGKALSHIDYIDAFRERSNRLTASYSKDGRLDAQGLVDDLFSALFYAKLETTYRKKMGPFLAGLSPSEFTVEHLAEWLERSTNLADGTSQHAAAKHMREITALASAAAEQGFMLIQSGGPQGFTVAELGCRRGRTGRHA